MTKAYNTTSRGADESRTFPIQSIKGSDLSAPITVDGESVISLPAGVIGIYNHGASDVTVNVILASDEIAEYMPVVVKPNETWKNGNVNMIRVTGSTNHTAATTRYLKGF